MHAVHASSVPARGSLPRSVGSPVNAGDGGLHTVRAGRAVVDGVVIFDRAFRLVGRVFEVSSLEVVPANDEVGNGQAVEDDLVSLHRGGQVLGAGSLEG